MRAVFFLFPGQACFIALSEARRTIGWLTRHFWIATSQEVAAYFIRDVSSVSRRIHNIDAAVRMNAEAIPQRSKDIRAFTKA